MVVTHTLLEKICFSLEGDHVHEVERVFVSVVLWDAELEKEAVCNKADVLVHKSRIHTDQLNGQRLCDEMVFNLDSLIDDLKDALVCELVVQVLVNEAGEVCVHAFVTGD